MGSIRTTLRILLLVAIACPALAGCADQNDQCGNGYIDDGEQCDGYILGTNTCESAGFAGGTLACRSDCRLDTSACFEESVCEPACDASICETCREGTCVDACEDDERCEEGTCVSEIETLTIFVTSDEHGWMEDELSGDGETMWGGAADLLGRFRELGYDPNTDESILISDGDMWTGPAISTWFDGESMVEVMNAMGYSAAALGNHEFDFGPDVLADRAEQADFPFLAANLTLDETGESPDYATPYTIVEVNGVQVGIIGLLLYGLPFVSRPGNIEGLVIGEYEAALRSAAPEAVEDGAEVLLVSAHACEDELLELTDVAAELGISVMTGGHCHEWNHVEQDGVPVVSPGAGMIVYAVVEIAFDTTHREVVGVEVELGENYYPASEENPVEPDAFIAAIVSRWRGRVVEALGEVIGYTASGIPIDWGLYNMIVDSWRWRFPEADLAFSNTGGVRSNIGQGDITLADIVGVQPFENELYIVTLTGDQVLDNLQCCGVTLLSGLSIDASGLTFSVSLSDGSTIDSAATYEVIVSDFIYEGGGGYLFSDQDPVPQYTGVFDREPIIDWIREQNTSTEQPLETLLDNTSRWLQ